MENMETHKEKPKNIAFVKIWNTIGAVICSRIHPQAATRPIHFSKGKTMAETTIKNPASSKTTAKPAKVGVINEKAKTAGKSKTGNAVPLAGNGGPIKSTTARKAPAARSSAKNKAATGKYVVSDEQRYRMIAEAAYFRAESCQFKSDPVRDWIEAERDIEKILLGKSD
ncbi:MAG: DUF2934 domain-containing protein [Candidatus Accumulibacter sp.]|jgi:hypothetical protein|nr:DUF2934 domain-containing protein [Accumulibacter sp.]